MVVIDIIPILNMMKQKVNFFDYCCEDNTVNIQVYTARKKSGWDLNPGNLPLDSEFLMNMLNKQV